MNLCIPCDLMFATRDDWLSHLASNHSYPCTRCRTAPGDPVSQLCDDCERSVEREDEARSVVPYREDAFPPGTVGPWEAA